MDNASLSMEEDRLRSGSVMNGKPGRSSGKTPMFTLVHK